MGEKVRPGDILFSDNGDDHHYIILDVEGEVVHVINFYPGFEPSVHTLPSQYKFLELWDLYRLVR